MKGYNDNIEALTIANSDFRRVLYTGRHLQLVLMTLQPGEEIGSEVHDGIDQFFRFEEGTGVVDIDGVENKVEDGSAVIVPSGACHNVRNTGDTPLKLTPSTGRPSIRTGSCRRPRRKRKHVTTTRNSTARRPSKRRLAVAQCQRRAKLGALGDQPMRVTNRIAVAAALLCTASAASAAPTYIHAGRLIAVPGQAVRGASTIIVDGGRILSVSPGHTAPPAGAVLIDLRGKTVLPGLIDSHVHLDSDRGGEADLLSFVREEPQMNALEGADERDEDHCAPASPQSQPRR
jgi:mannose-6-phosphate isomerase-like protein (cupin superfamily)